MIRTLFFLLALAITSEAAEPVSTNQPTVIVVVGAGGEAEFGGEFIRWGGLWQKAAQTAGAKFVWIGPTSTNTVSETETNTDLDLFQQALDKETKAGVNELWVVLLGHGTFDGKQPKFNLRGPDLTATNLSTWLSPFQRPLAVIDTASSSGPFLKALAGTNRVVITSTRSGFEQNYARFGRYLSESLVDAQADLDKDGQVSLLEMFISAATKTDEFYKTDGRLATEHPLLEDNGDGLGTPPDWFRGIRATKKSADGTLPDGLRAHQFHLIRSAAEQNMSPEVRQQRDSVEREIAALREAKSTLKEDEYYQRLESLLLQISKLYFPDKK